MSFKVFNPVAVGRGGLDGQISITGTQINFGKRIPPYPHVVIEYDVENTAIRFSKGDEATGYKVHNHKGSYFINAYSFIRREVLPSGRYKLVEGWTYRRGL